MSELKTKKLNKTSLERLLKENLELNEKIYKSCQKTEKYIFSIRAWGIIKFVLVLIPVIIGVLYLIPLVGNFIDLYKDFFINAGETTGILNTVKDIRDLR